MESLQSEQKQKGTPARAKLRRLEFSRKMEGKSFRFSLVDTGQPLHRQVDGRFWLDWELCANWTANQETVTLCQQVTVTLGRNVQDVR